VDPRSPVTRNLNLFRERFDLPLLSLLIACPTPSPGETGEPEDELSEACGTEERVVTFETEDGLTLEADYAPAAAEGAPAIVLFHMNPERYDRRGYTKAVRASLAERGALLNVDRRGAGGSEGSARDAFEGEGGRLDMEAAVDFLLGRECSPDPERLFLVGASNGTTSVYDYMVAGRGDLPFPAAVVFLSPGSYTENQFPLEPVQADRGWSLSFPMLWIYPETEPYSDDFVADAPGAWKFVRHGDEHGTDMFDEGVLESATMTEILAWVEAI